MASPFTGGLPREAALTVQNPNSSLKNMPTALLERKIMPFASLQTKNRSEPLYANRSPQNLENDTIKFTSAENRSSSHLFQRPQCHSAIDRQTRHPIQAQKQCLCPCQRPGSPPESCPVSQWQSRTQQDLLLDGYVFQVRERKIFHQVQVPRTQLVLKPDRTGQGASQTQVPYLWVQNSRPPQKSSPIFPKSCTNPL